MTVYLISLAIMFLVAIALFDGMSGARKIVRFISRLAATEAVRPIFLLLRFAWGLGWIVLVPHHSRLLHRGGPVVILVTRCIDEVPVLF